MVAFIIICALLALVAYAMVYDPREQAPPVERDMRRVYIMRGKTKMTKVKIGYSSRLDERRKVELERISRIGLEMIAEVSCNYAWHLEQEIHKALKRCDLIREYNGMNEWYVIPVRGQPSVIIIIEEIAVSLSKRLPKFEFNMIIHSTSIKRWMPAANLRR